MPDGGTPNDGSAARAIAGTPCRINVAVNTRLNVTPRPDYWPKTARDSNAAGLPKAGKVLSDLWLMKCKGARDAHGVRHAR